MKQSRNRGRVTLRVGFSLAWLALATAAACGRDEGTARSGGTSGTGGTAPTSETAGTAGRPDDLGAGGVSDSAGGAPAGSGGGIESGGTSGSGGFGMGGSGGVLPLLPGTGVGTIGRICSGPQDCGLGLTCITANHQLLNGSAPPHGFCSSPCTSDQQCAEHSPDSLCVPFGPNGTPSYCVEGCSFGAPAIGTAKCHGRPDFACVPALVAPTFSTCGSAQDDCLPGELCIDGLCNIVLPACLPACRGDLDCAPGLYCDQGFLAGTCTPKKPVGKRLGEPCTVPSPQEPNEPDGCLGFCQADGETGSNGHCSATCGLARECAWDPATRKFDGVCFYASVLTEDDSDVGDFGFCTPTCNCDDGCSDPTLACSILSQGPLSVDFSGPGLCFGDDGESTCGAGMASAGAGGTGVGGAGAGAGAGGAP